jgi:hypothetical protein
MPPCLYRMFPPDRGWIWCGLIFLAFDDPRTENDLRIAEELGHKEAQEAKKTRMKRKIFT